jgi:hypothetical protein
MFQQQASQNISAPHSKLRYNWFAFKKTPEDVPFNDWNQLQQVKLKGWKAVARKDQTELPELLILSR